MEPVLGEAGVTVGGLTEALGRALKSEVTAGAAAVAATVRTDGAAEAAAQLVA